MSSPMGASLEGMLGPFCPQHASPRPRWSWTRATSPAKLHGPLQGPFLLPGCHPGWLGPPALPGLLEGVSASVPVRWERSQSVRSAPGEAVGMRAKTPMSFSPAFIGRQVTYPGSAPAPKPTRTAAPSKRPIQEPWRATGPAPRRP